MSILEGGGQRRFRLADRRYRTLVAHRISLSLSLSLFIGEISRGFNAAGTIHPFVIT
jgi:hypothetical protein